VPEVEVLQDEDRNPGSIPVANYSKEVGKRGIELVLPDDGENDYAVYAADTICITWTGTSGIVLARAVEDVHNRRDDGKHVARDEGERRDTCLEGEAERVDCRRVVPNHAQAERDGQDLPERTKRRQYG